MLVVADPLSRSIRSVAQRAEVGNVRALQANAELTGAAVSLLHGPVLV